MITEYEIECLHHEADNDGDEYDRGFISALEWILEIKKTDKKSRLNEFL